MLFIASLVSLLIPFEVNGIELTPQTLLTNQAKDRLNSENQMRSKTSVVSHEFPDDKLWYKEKKEDLDTFAELQYDPKASFPPSFTICSTLMRSAFRSYASIFFTLLGKGNRNYLSAFLGGGMDSLTLTSGLFTYKPEGKIDLVFPEQWISSCLAVNTESGLLQWVVDSELIANVTIKALRQNAPEHPADLSGRLLLGVQNQGPGIWTTYSHKVKFLLIYITISLKPCDLDEFTRTMKVMVSPRLDCTRKRWKNMKLF